MGPLVEQSAVPFIEGAVYPRLPDPARAFMLDGLIDRIREAARNQAAAEKPALFAKLKGKRTPKRQRDLVEYLKQ